MGCSGEEKASMGISAAIAAKVATAKIVLWMMIFSCFLNPQTCHQTDTTMSVSGSNKTKNTT